MRSRQIEGATLRSGDPATVVHGLSIDSRTTGPGDLFAAFPGAHVDGHEFIDAAVERGAAAVLCRTRRELGPGAAAVLEAPDVLSVVQALTRQVRRRSAARVVGVAGSAGKTSTKDALRALLAPHLRVVAAHRNHNNELGVPLTLARIERDTEVCICELAMRGLGQIADLTRIAEPDLGVITCVGPEHLEFLGDVPTVAVAQAELLEALPEGGVAVIPDDEPLLEPFLRPDLDVRRFGLTPAADVQILRFEPVADGAEIELDVLGDARRLPHEPARPAPRAEPGRRRRGRARPRRAGLRARRGRRRGRALAAPRPGARTPIWRRRDRRCLQREPRLDARGARRACTRGAARGGSSPCSARWPSSDPRLPSCTARSPSVPRGIDLVVGIGELARLYLDKVESAWFADIDAAAEGLPALLQPGDVVLLKASRSVGLERLLEVAS